MGTYLEYTKFPNLLVKQQLVDVIEKDLGQRVDVTQLVQIHMVSCLS